MSTLQNQIPSEGFLSNQTFRTPCKAPSRNRRQSVSYEGDYITNSRTRKIMESSSKSRVASPREFYELRNRTIPVFNSIEDKAEGSNVSGKQEKPHTGAAPRFHFCKRAVSWLLRTAILISLIIFLNIFMYNLGHSYFYEPLPALLRSSEDQLVMQHLTQEIDKHIERRVEEYRETKKRIEMSIQQLKNDIKSLKSDINKFQKLTTNSTQPSQSGIMEELLIADLACAGNLGSVLATPNTETFMEPATISLMSLIPFWMEEPHKPPLTTIQGIITEVGDCWAFVGNKGRLVLKLNQHSLVTGVSVSHITPSSSPTGDISSAPKRFQVLAHRADNNWENGEVLGDFEYHIPGSWRQTFDLITREELFDIIEFRFLTNHGNPNFTCIYRVHVHGTTPT